MRFFRGERRVFLYTDSLSPSFYSVFLEAIFEVAWFCGMGMIAAPFEYPGILVFCGGLQGEDNKNGQNQLFMPACILLANYGRKNEKSL